MAQKPNKPKKPALKRPRDHDDDLHRWALKMNPWVAAVQAWMWDAGRQPACGAAAAAVPGAPVPYALQTRTQPPPPPPPKYPPA